MINHYIKIAFRNMRKYKVQALTGVFGLVLGLMCFIPAIYWMYYETSYDSFYPDAKHIYRIYSIDKQSGQVNEGLSSVFEKKLKEQYPAIEASALFLKSQENCRTQEMPHVQLNMLYTDGSFFDVFSPDFVSGDVREPLDVLNNIVITEATAIRLFGDAEGAIGQQIQTTMNASLPPYMVTAVVKDVPSNTNLPFDAIINHNMIKYFSELPEEMQWSMSFMELYVKLHPNTNIKQFNDGLRDFVAQQNSNISLELRMLPISDVRHRLNSNSPFNLNFIKLFVISGALLLFCALFNFLNLHLDLFRQRVREFRLRAIHGASVGQLIRQMIFELSCFVSMALLFAFGFLILLRPVFSGLLKIDMGMSQLSLFFAVCGIGTMVLILSIGYILFLRLSHLSTRPQFVEGVVGRQILRHVAVVLQLSISVVLIFTTLVVMMQMRFVNQKDLGFNPDGIIQLSGFVDASGRIEKALVDELATIPQIESFTDAFFQPQHSSPDFTITSEVEWQGKAPFEKPVFHFIPTDSRFSETFGLNMVMGKWWNEGEMQNIVLNEEAIKVMGLAEPIIGSIVYMPSPEDTSIMEEYRVAGVVNDFHTLSLRNKIQPTIFRPSPYPFNIIYARVLPGYEWNVIQRIVEILPNIDATMTDTKITPLNELYSQLSQLEHTGLKLFSALTTFCLLISIFGIYAVSSTSTIRRRKEIAIRKIVGAEAQTIVRMFFHEYALQVVIAGVIMLPFAFLIMNSWLQEYAYHITIPWWLPIGVLTGVLVVVSLTVLRQVLNAANNNPAEVIKSE